MKNSRELLRRLEWLWVLGILAFWVAPVAAERIELELALGPVSEEQAISAEDVTVEVDGNSAEVLSLASAPPLRVVVYIDGLLSSTIAIHNGLLELADQAPTLVELGEVEVVYAGDELKRPVPPTRSAEQLGEALGWLRLRSAGGGGQLAVRERFVEEASLTDVAATKHLAISATAGQRLAEIASLLREAIASEAELLALYREQLLSWAAGDVSAEPKVLLLVGGGFDQDPGAFYRELLRPLGLEELVESETIPEINPSLADLAKTLSAVGWSVWPYSPEVGIDALLEGGEPESPAEVTTTYEGGRRVDRTVITPQFDLIDRLKEKLGGDQQTAEAKLLEPRAGLSELARQSGGRVLVDRTQVESALRSLGGRVRVVIESPPISGLMSVTAAVARDGVSTRRWVTSGTPELLNLVRARELLDGEALEGGLFVEAVAEQIETGEDTAAVRMEIVAGRSLMDDSRGSFARLAVTAVAFESAGGLSSERRELIGEEAAQGAFTLELSSTPAPDTPIVVLVEDLDTGDWGGAYANLIASGSLAAVGGVGGFLPAPRAVHLLAPPGPLAVGRLRIETVLSDRVKKVEFYLDGKLEVVRKSAPYSVPVTLGRYPDRHSVEAVAYDAAGLELGRDRLILNAGTGTFRVRISSPEDPGDPSDPLTGSVVVRAAVEMPRGSELERVQFYWNGELFATRFAPPFAQRFLIPEDGPSGFFRVEALLADGSKTEDVLFVNSPGGSERVRVELVELFTVVTDRDGRPVTQLPAEAFTVFEDGVEQEVTTFSEAGDLPLTVGLAIDSSASMFIKLPDVQRAAATFVNALGSTRDRAFLVRFGGGPELVRDTTMDLADVRSALYSLEPDGRTEIWKGIVYSLVQLQSVPGKKALIVFSDGADEDPEFSFRTCLRFARQVGVPVYVIVSNDEIYRTQGKGLTIRGFMNRLEELVRSVGGRVFVTRVGGDLDAIYAQIDEELRSQYLLGYYVRDAGGDRFREVRVDVEGRGLEARTIGGYYR